MDLKLIPYATIEVACELLRSTRQAPVGLGAAAVFFVVAATAVVGSLFMGHRDKLPQLTSVSGTVLTPNGDAITAGVVEALPVGEGRQRGTGVIQDGKFAMKSIYGNTVGKGLAPGQYRLLVTPSFEAVPKTHQLEDAFTVGAARAEWTVRVPVDDR